MDIEAEENSPTPRITFLEFDFELAIAFEVAFSNALNVNGKHFFGWMKPQMMLTVAGSRITVTLLTKLFQFDRVTPIHADIHLTRVTPTAIVCQGDVSIAKKDLFTALRFPAFVVLFLLVIPIETGSIALLLLPIIALLFFILWSVGVAYGYGEHLENFIKQALLGQLG